MYFRSVFKMLSKIYHVPFVAMDSNVSGVRSTTSALTMRHCRAIKSRDVMNEP